TVRSGIDFYTERGQLRTSKGSFVSTGNTGIPGQSYSWNGTRVGGYNTGQNQGYSINNDLLLTGSKSFSDDKFEVDYLAGGTIFYTQYDNVIASTVGGLLVPNFFSLNSSVEPAKVAELNRKQQVNSLYGRLAFSWNKTFFVEATGRNDWNSTLSEDTRSFFYPSVSGSFVVSELLPEATKDWLDLFKIRGSWTTSKKAPGIYDINQSREFIIRPGTWNDENGAIAPTTLYPDNVFSERFTTYEVGMQGMFLKKRLTFDLTYYNKNSFDRLIKGNVTSASGYNKVFVNTEEERSTKGWEIAMNVSPVKTEDFQWDLGFNWTTFNTTYTKLRSIL
ncbi:MAG: SusC/RagA family TonB-linked outer membrane protein, partial [Bacteroidales bacterium]|nr:SusC/RagA family TonB-linked outer membrane protein [Bacteroidales bacterium]